jgi:hypothetical protein
MNPFDNHHMTANIDIIKDFSRLQAECRALGESNVRFAQENARLRTALQSSTGNLILWQKSDPIGTAHFLPERIKSNEDILSNIAFESRVEEEKQQRAEEIWQEVTDALSNIQ